MDDGGERRSFVGAARDNERVTESPLATTQNLFAQALEALRGVVHAGSAAERRFEAHRRTTAAEQVVSRVGLDGSPLIDLLDQDGEAPDNRPPVLVNELLLTRLPDGGGKLKGRFDDAALFDAIAAVIDAHAKPLTADDDRSTGERQAEALAGMCGYVLDHGDVPECGGRRPHVNVLIGLEDLENRARAACLDFGGPVTPESLRMLCCDAAVAPIVVNGKGQPLDVGRITRTIPDGLRRAVAARDRGCAHPGCDRPISWVEIHHIREWEFGGETKLTNLVALCRVHHRQIHSTEWIVRIRDGLPEFIPPRWLDSEQRPRRRALLQLAAAQ